MSVSHTFPEECLLKVGPPEVPEHVLRSAHLLALGERGKTRYGEQLGLPAIEWHVRAAPLYCHFDHVQRQFLGISEIDLERR